MLINDSYYFAAEQRAPAPRGPSVIVSTATFSFFFRHLKSTKAHSRNNSGATRLNAEMGNKTSLDQSVSWFSFFSSPHSRHFGFADEVTLLFLSLSLFL